MLAADDYPPTKAKTEMLQVVNFILNWVFLAEMFVKVYGLGLTGYFRDSYNVFDFFIVCVSILDMIIENFFTQSDASGNDIFKAIRALRLLRSIKLMRSWAAMQEIISKARKSLADVVLFGILLALIMFILSLLGMELFANYCKFTTDGTLVTDVVKAKAEGAVLMSPRENFDNIGNAFTTMFILVVGEMWPTIMYNYTRVYDADGVGNLNSGLVNCYFVMVIISGNLIMMSLFTSILLDNFEQGDEDKKTVSLDSDESGSDSDTESDVNDYDENEQ
jgi:hypothetical protein